MDFSDLMDLEHGSKNIKYNEHEYNKQKRKHNKSKYWEINLSNIAWKLWNYKKFIPVIIIVGILIIAIIIGIIVLFYPYIKSFIMDIDQNWLKSVVESGSWVLNKIRNWSGW